MKPYIDINIDIDELIAQNHHQEELLYESWFCNLNFLANELHKEIITYLNQALTTTSSEDTRKFAQVHALLAFFKLIFRSHFKPEEIIVHLQTAIDSQNNLAYCLLSYCYKNGVGVRKDIQKALMLRNIAHERGSILGTYALAGCYHNGAGVRKNLPKAIALYTSVCKMGGILAVYELGKYYYEGIGIPKDLQKAVTLFTAAHERGSIMGTIAVGQCYLHGAGVPKNSQKALTLFISAYRKGATAAAIYLSDFYYFEQENYPEAFAWLLKALHKSGTIEQSDIVLKNLYRAFKKMVTTEMTKSYVSSIAKSCFFIYKKYPELLEKIRPIVDDLLKTFPNDFELHYWARFINGLGCSMVQKATNTFYLENAIYGLIRENPNAFLTLLLRDNIHSDEEKLPFYQHIAANFLKNQPSEKALSGENIFLLFQRLKYLTYLRNHEKNPNSYFNLIPQNLLEKFAESLLPQEVAISASNVELPKPSMS